MDSPQDLRPALGEKANDILSRLSPGEREALLVKGWLSHDARWFMAVATECGLEVTNRVNRTAAHEVGRVEARRIARALQLPPVSGIDDYLLAQEVLIGLLGPDLLDYSVSKVGDAAFQVCVRRCFAFDNATRTGVTDGFGCGIFARITGWLDVLGLTYELAPSTEECLRAQGQECIHTVALEPVAREVS
jgi:Family of unknown function (DUF6125)